MLKKDLHSYLIKMTVLLLLMPIASFVFFLKVGFRPIHGCVCSVAIFSYILIKICFVVARKYSVKTRRRIKRQ